MANAKEKAQDKEKAQMMLTKYLDGQEPALYHSVNGATDGGQSGRSFRRKFYVIDGVRDGQGRGDARIVDVTLYVANLCGLRMDDWNSSVSRMTPQEIVTMVEQKIGRAVKINGL